MSVPLIQYLNDGASFQAKAVLAYICDIIGEGLENTFNGDKNTYDAIPVVARWSNGREQGYVISLENYHEKQINIAFFEHRNSDNICAVEWEQIIYNSPTIDNADFGDKYQDKSNVSKTVEYGEDIKMAEWIVEILTKFWEL